MTGASVATGRLTATQVSAVLDLAGRAAAADSVAPLSEHVLLHLRYEGTAPESTEEDGRDLLLTVNGEIAGYAYLDVPAEPSGELVIDPAHRGRGLGRALVDELTAQAAGSTLRVWAHGDLPAAVSLAKSAGFERFRALWQMRRSLRDPLDQPDLQAGITLRTFVTGRDEDDWLHINATAFADHPEQGTWTRHDLELRESEPWFDPAGFFIAERSGVMAGFHWTKVHSPEDDPQGSAIGEVYVVGVDPAEQGTGLGRALTLAGLLYLRGLGLEQAMLYVDEDNVPAVRMYNALGFSRTRVDAMYRKPTRAKPRGGTGGSSPPEPAQLAVVNAQRLVKFVRGQRPIGGRHRGQHLRVELDLVEGIAVMNTKIQLLRNRAHLRHCS